MARLSGGPKSITNSLNMQEWIKQADQYDQIRNDNLWSKALQLSIIIGQSHPFSAVRVREIFKWGESSQYKNLMQNLKAEESGKKCPECKLAVCADWTFCKHCGTKL